MQVGQAAALVTELHAAHYALDAVLAAADERDKAHDKILNQLQTIRHRLFSLRINLDARWMPAAAQREGEKKK